MAHIVRGDPAGCLTAALTYAAAGWPVFPCQPRRKTPFPRSRGFKDATTDPGRLRAWWARWPDANVAVATGEPAVDVLDVDVKPGVDGYVALGRLRRAGLVTGAQALARTRSGGLHIYFAGSGQKSGARDKIGLDFRACGGYVLVPPSWVDSDDKGPAGRYEWIDRRHGTATFGWSAALRLLDPPRTPTARAPVWNGGELPASVRWALTAPAADRSAALHRLIGTCVRAGLDTTTIHDLAAGFQPALEKYGQRLAAEVDRSLSKIGAL
ncbi:MAG TPA: bifunctional DNA primase/polymerase [Streptosporangiaceae bacterium]|nr:bifunctional DNA primase/polymerase [Streptosporangiaceae bacterium]